MSDVKPLVLDADGTFLRTDMLYECLWAGLGRAPMATLAAIAGHFADRAALKAELARIAPIRTDLLPVHRGIAEIASESIRDGREVVLASASDATLVEKVAHDFGLSSRYFASNGVVNLKGPEKADALLATYGERGFDYAGNDAADMAVWTHAENAIIVGNVRGAEAALAAGGRNVTHLDGGWSPRDLARALRPHQWVKNVLLFLPVVAAHDFRVETLLLALLGVLAFSLSASCIYVVNDLLDLEADRLHPTKRNRPFASGAVPIKIGMIACVLVGLVALTLAAMLGIGFFGVIVVYIALSLAYSLKLKRMRWVDVTVLASLYTLRVVAGAVAADVYLTGHLIAFIFPVFLTLGCVKRLTEVTLATDDARLPGRGYGRADRDDLLNVAAIGMAAALVIFGLYSFSAQAEVLYPSRWLLWIAMLPMAAWLLRMIRIGWAGRMDYDPVVFALRDPRGLGYLFLVISLMFYSAGLFHDWFGI